MTDGLAEFIYIFQFRRLTASKSLEQVLCEKNRNPKKVFISYSLFILMLILFRKEKKCYIFIIIILQVPGEGCLERRILEINRKRVKVVKPGSKTSFPTTEIRGSYAPPFHVSLFLDRS